MSALREILATFDIVVNDGQLDAANQRLDSFVDKLKGIAAAFAGFKLVKSIVDFGEGVAKAAREVEFHAGRMEMGVEEYQKLSQVAENYGVTMESLQIANTLFVRALGNAGGVTGVLGGHSQHAAAAMKSLGLNAKQFQGQKLQDILPVISDAMLKIKDPLERVTTGLNLFGHRGRAILPMMAQGGAEIRRQFAAAVPVFEELTIKSADEATLAMKGLSRAWDNLINNSFGKAVMDAMTVVAKKLTDVVLWLKDLAKNSEIGKGVLASLGIAMVVVAGLIIAAWWPVLVPILAIIAAFAALALIIDDLIVFMEGGKSVTGDLIDRLFGEGGADKARKFLEDLWTDFKAFVERVKNTTIPEFLDDFRRKLAEIRALIHDIQTAWGFLQGIADKIANQTGLTDANLKKAWGAVSGAVGGAADAVADATGLTDANVVSFLNGPSPAGIPAPNFVSIPKDDRGSGAMLSPSYNFTLVNPIDGASLSGELGRVAGAHHDRALRDALGAVGGSK